MDNVGTKGTGPFAGQVWDGKKWIPDPHYVAPPAPAEGGPPPVGAIWNGQQWVMPTYQQMPTVQQRPGNNTGMLVGGVISLCVAGVLLLFAWSWFMGYLDLESQGNPFSGALLVLALAAGAGGAGFVVLGVVLLMKRS